MQASANPDRRRMLALTAAALAAPSLVLAAAPALQQMGGRAFGAEWSLSLPAGRDASGMRPALQALLAETDRLMSPWRPDSEISRFNGAPRGLAVAPETAMVARAALDLARASEGWFDPSVGPLVHRWGFGPIEGELSGWAGLAAGDGGLTKDRAGLTLDPCGIAKGRALDLMADQLLAAGWTDFLVDLGGELAARGRHPSGRDWQLAIEDPRPGVPGAAALLRLDGLAIATSGTRAQGYDLAGRRFSHIIDPHRAAPVRGPLASVSVVAPRAMLADGWATALMAAGAAGPALAQRRGVTALFLFRAGAGLRSQATGGFDRHLL